MNNQSILYDELTAITWKNYYNRFLSKTSIDLGRKFYIYELPEIFWWRWPDERNSTCKGNKYVDNQHAENRAVGRPIRPESGLFLTWHFSMFNALYNRFVRSKRRTLNPDEASLFIIPYDLSLDGYLDSKTCTNKAPLRCTTSLVNEVRNILTASKYFQKNQGEHLFSVISNTLIINTLAHLN